MTMHGVGSVVGNIIYPRLGDTWGRRPVFLVCIIGVAIVNTIKAFSPMYWFYAVMAAVSGMQEQVCT